MVPASTTRTSITIPWHPMALKVRVRCCCTFLDLSNPFQKRAHEIWAACLSFAGYKASKNFAIFKIVSCKAHIFRPVNFLTIVWILWQRAVDLFSLEFSGANVFRPVAVCLSEYVIIQRRQHENEKVLHEVSTVRSSLLRWFANCLNPSLCLVTESCGQSD